MAHPTSDPTAPWRLPTPDEASLYLYQLAQAQTMIEANTVGTEWERNVDGKVVPTRAAIDQVNRDNPILLRIAMQKTPA